MFVCVAFYVRVDLLLLYVVYFIYWGDYYTLCLLV